MTTYRAGYASDCGCCGPAPYKSGSFSAYHDWSQGGGEFSNNTIDLGVVRLFKYSSGSAGIEDKTLDVDVSPIQGVHCSTAFHQTFTLNLLDGGVVVGSVTYQYVSGESNFNGRSNLTIDYGGHVYHIENGGSEGYYAQGLRVIRTDFTTIDGETP